MALLGLCITMPRHMNETDEICKTCNAVPDEAHTTDAQGKPCPGDE